MKNITKLFLFFLLFFTLLSNSLYAQLDSEHFLPPLKQAVNNQAIQQQEIYLSTPVTTAFSVQVYRGNNPVSIGTITGLANGAPKLYTTFIPLPDGDNNITLVDNNNTGVVLSNSGLRFVSPGGQKFYVNYRGRSGAQAGSLTAKGSKALGYEFRWGGIPNRASNVNLTTSLGIMATVNGTVVNVFGYNPNCEFRVGNAQGGNTADSFSINLNAGQTYVIEAATNQTAANVDGWLGATLTSNQPIAISNGGLNVGIQTGSQSRDVGIDQPVPISIIGKDYVFVRGNGTDQSEFPIIVGTSNGTDVFVGGAYFATINDGEYVEIPGSFYSSSSAGANMYVRTSKEAYAFQCLTGLPNAIQTIGMNFIAPVNCLMPNVLDEISAINFIAGLASNQSAVTIIASTSTVDANITVTDSNGTKVLPSSLPATGTTEWKTFFVTGLVGQVKVNSTGPIAVGTFGSQGTNAGYAGYFSGFDTVPIVGLSVSGSGCFPGTLLQENSGTFDAYQWYRDGVLIPGATSNTYAPLVIGDYLVRVTKGSCSYDSGNLPVFNCDPDILITKTDNLDPINELENVTFTIRVKSLGVNPVTNVVIQDVLPAGFTLVSATPSFGTWTSPNWTIGTMTAGQVRNLVIVAKADFGTGGTTLTNSISNTQDQIDSNASVDDPNEPVTIHTIGDVDPSTE